MEKGIRELDCGKTKVMQRKVKLKRKMQRCFWLKREEGKENRASST